MSSTATPSSRPMDPAVLVARDKEDVVVGDEVVRHKLSSRVIHWAVSVTFFVCLFTGFPIWTPFFGWMAALFGGLSVCRVVHPWAGLAFFLAYAVMFFDWMSDMVFRPDEKGWFGPKLFRYLRWEHEDDNVGKYNGGQKFFFWTAAAGAIGLILSGLVMWFPESFPALVRQFAFVLHDITFVLFAVAIVFHIYLSTVAEPGTFRSMTRGTVTRKWARLHHPGWYRDVTGKDSHRS
ncbi:MAG TPA: formate dehydrogenase subunit gamma [Thermoanaerobaculia bacterium]|nr:formate dehydrogenase subunit gamma [Thermoanaerobaculia bacterium]